MSGGSLTSKMEILTALVANMVLSFLCVAVTESVKEFGSASKLKAWLPVLLAEPKSTWPEVAIQFDNARVAQPGYWIAGYPGSVGTGQLYVGAEGHQFIDHGSWDESVFVDFLPGIDPAPVPDLPPNVPVTTTYKENQMLARNTAGNGYWAVRPDGSTYAFDGAPYLGPAPHYRAEWGIGTAANPIVGIADDGHGGFVLEADTGAYPGTPALYRIDASGKYGS